MISFAAFAKTPFTVSLHFSTKIGWRSIPLKVINGLLFVLEKLFQKESESSLSNTASLLPPFQNFFLLMTNK